MPRSAARQPGTQPPQRADFRSWHEPDHQRCPQFARYREETGHGPKDPIRSKLTHLGSRRLSNAVRPKNSCSVTKLSGWQSKTFSALALYFSNVLRAAPVWCSRNRQCSLNQSAGNRGSRCSYICMSRKYSAGQGNPEGRFPWSLPLSRCEATRTL